MSDYEMPTLPETAYGLFYESPFDDDGEGSREFIDAPGYTSDQMRAYARAYALEAVKAEREACAKLVDSAALKSEPDDFALDALYAASSAIRARGKS